MEKFLAIKSKMQAGARYNRLVAVEFVKKDSIGSQHWWKFLCDCGNTHITRVNSVRMGRTKSCGCLNKEAKTLRQKKPDGIASAKKQYNAYKSNATKRGYSFSLTFDMFKNICEKSCFYCGKPPSMEIKASGGRSSNWIYNGIDRVDNTSGYYLQNCVPCCKICNRAKRDSSFSEFIEWINGLVKFKKDKQ